MPGVKRTAACSVGERFTQTRTIADAAAVAEVGHRPQLGRCHWDGHFVWICKHSKHHLDNVKKTDCGCRRPPMTKRPEAHAEGPWGRW